MSSLSNLARDVATPHIVLDNTDNSYLDVKTHSANLTSFSSWSNPWRDSAGGDFQTFYKFVPWDDAVLGVGTCNLAEFKFIREDTEDDSSDERYV
jgi:hypothetical protein